EIMWEVAVHLDAKKVPEEDLGPGPWYVPRGFLRYHIYPYDKAMWGKLRDPIWVMFTLGSLIPVSGFYALVYAVIFLVIDKRDEFQLLQFILQFKGTQFLSHGVIRTIMGFFMFVNCVSSQAQEEQHSCENHGPGTAEFYRGMYEFSIFGWVLQVMLMWAAYFCLRCSIEKGRKELKGRVGSHADPAAHHDEAPMTVGLQQPSNKRISREFRHTGATGPGGYIRYFLLYDAVCFTVVLCGLFIVIALRPEGIGQAYYHWSIRHAFFSAQVVYGYLSMPFFLFMIPVLQRFLTHSIDTAYDTKGRCVAYAGPKRKRDEDEEAKKNRWGSVFDPSNLEQATAGVALNAKLEALYDKVKDIMTNIPKMRPSCWPRKARPPSFLPGGRPVRDLRRPHAAEAGLWLPGSALALYGAHELFQQSRRRKPDGIFVCTRTRCQSV
ncbi:unnamed protein product, partial [Prorocentrum cordatum]